MHRIICTIFLAFSQLTVAVGGERLEISSSLAEVLSRRYPRDGDDLRLLERQVQQVAEVGVAATVGVEVGRNIGSGVIVSEDGLVLTAAHVIGGADRPATIVLSDGRRLRARTLGAHHPLDAAMVQILDAPDDLPFVPAVEDDQAPEGAWVVAVGQPGGVFADRSPPVRLGRVLAADQQWYCTDCTLVGGDSGGPLFNMRGEVMAIHMSIGPSVIHNFHVPLVLIRQYWDRMLAGEVWGKTESIADRSGSRVVMGIAGRTVDGRCEVTQVFSGFPAEQAGIRVGDIIRAVDGQAVESIAEISRMMQEKGPGKRVQLEIDRRGEIMEREVRLFGTEIPLPGSQAPGSLEQSNTP